MGTVRQHRWFPRLSDARTAKVTAAARFSAFASGAVERPARRKGLADTQRALSLSHIAMLSSWSWLYGI